ncbi:hypothetical protein [Treponema sp. R6D11]
MEKLTNIQKIEPFSKEDTLDTFASIIEDINVESGAFCAEMIPAEQIDAMCEALTPIAKDFFGAEYSAKMIDEAKKTPWFSYDFGPAKQSYLVLTTLQNKENLEVKCLRFGVLHAEHNSGKEMLINGVDVSLIMEFAHEMYHNANARIYTAGNDDDKLVLCKVGLKFKKFPVNQIGKTLPDWGFGYGAEEGIAELFKTEAYCDLLAEHYPDFVYEEEQHSYTKVLEKAEDMYYNDTKAFQETLDTAFEDDLQIYLDMRYKIGVDVASPEKVRKIMKSFDDAIIEKTDISVTGTIKKLLP